MRQEEVVEANPFSDATTNSMTAQMMTAPIMMDDDGKDDDGAMMMARMMTRRKEKVEEEARGGGGSEPVVATQQGMANVRDASVRFDEHTCVCLKGEERNELLVSYVLIPCTRRELL